MGFNSAFKGLTLQAQWILYRYQVEHLNNLHSSHILHLRVHLGFATNSDWGLGWRSG